MKELAKMISSTKISSKKMMIILKNLKKVRFPLDSQKELTLESRSLGEAEHMV
jgi:hypothetical protein